MWFNILKWYKPWTWFDDVKNDIIDSLYSVILHLFLLIDSIIYKFVGFMYDVFLAVANARVFDNSIYETIVSRLYIIISIVMLFIIAYSFLMVIINPEYFSNGKMSPYKLIRNIVTSLFLIIIVPVLFDFSYNVISSIVNNNVIAKVVLGNEYEKFDDSSDFAVSIFETNFYMNYDSYDFLINELGFDENELENISVEGFEELNLNFDDYVSSYSEVKDLENFTDAYNNVHESNNIIYYNGALNAVKNDHATYNFIISSVVGIFVLYVLAVYCIDLGLRAIKLGFYQIIAPIPILFRMIPGQEKTFNSWAKDTISTFIEVVVKMSILVFCVFMISAATDNFDIVFPAASFSKPVKKAAEIAVILGLVLFLKQAPKLLSDLFGIKLDKGSFNLKEKLKDSGTLSFIGGMAGTVGGYSAAVIGNRKRGSNVFSSSLKAFASVPRGARTGFKTGGIKGLGAAFNEAKDTQLYRAKRGGGARSVVYSAMDQLRDNIGMDSVYDSEIKNEQIKFEAKMRRIKENIRQAEKGSTEKISEIKEQSRKANSRTNSALDEMTKLMDLNKEETYKDSCKTQLKFNLPTVIKYDDVSSKFGVDVGNILDDLGVSGSWDQVSEDGTTKRMANYHSITSGIEQIDSEISNLGPLPDNPLARKAYDAKFNDLNEKRKALIDAQAEILSNNNKNQIIEVEQTVNAHTLKDYQSNLQDIFMDAGFSSADAASKSNEYSLKFKDYFDALEKQHINDDLNDENSKLKSGMAKVLDYVSSENFGGNVEFKDGKFSAVIGENGKIIQNQDLVEAFKKFTGVSNLKDLENFNPNNLKNFDGASVVEAFKALKGHVTNNSFIEDEAMRKSIVNIIKDGNNDSTTLSRLEQDIKTWNEEIKAEEERLKIKQQAYEDHKNNSRSKSGK